MVLLSPAERGALFLSKTPALAYGLTSENQIVKQAIREFVTKLGIDFDSPDNATAWEEYQASRR